MIIDVERIPDEGLAIIKDFEFVCDELVEENAVFLETVHVEGIVRKTGEDVLVKGRIATRLNFICCRCLAPFEFPVDSDFNLIFLPEELEVDKEQLEREDINSLFYHKRSIDFADVILEQLNLTFPLRPLCSNECQGLCPVCGNLVNDGICSCTKSETARRLEKLKIFLRDKS